MYLSNANKSKTYYLYFVNPITNNLTSRSCKTKIKREAKEFLKNFRIENIDCPKEIPTNLKLSDIKERILSHYKMNNALQTYRSVKSTLENLIRHIGNKPISSVNKSDIEDFKIKEE